MTITGRNTRKSPNTLFMEETWAQEPVLAFSAWELPGSGTNYLDRALLHTAAYKLLQLPHKSASAPICDNLNSAKAASGAKAKSPARWESHPVYSKNRMNRLPSEISIITPNNVRGNSSATQDPFRESYSSGSFPALEESCRWDWDWDLQPNN